MPYILKDSTAKQKFEESDCYKKFFVAFCETYLVNERPNPQMLVAAACYNKDDASLFACYCENSVRFGDDMFAKGQECLSNFFDIYADYPDVSSILNLFKQVSEKELGLLDSYSSYAQDTTDTDCSPPIAPEKVSSLPPSASSSYTSSASATTMQKVEVEIEDEDIQKAIIESKNLADSESSLKGLFEYAKYLTKHHELIDTYEKLSTKKASLLEEIKQLEEKLTKSSSAKEEPITRFNVKDSIKPEMVTDDVAAAPDKTATTDAAKVYVEKYKENTQLEKFKSSVTQEEKNDILREFENDNIIFEATLIGLTSDIEQLNAVKKNLEESLQHQKSSIQRDTTTEPEEQMHMVSESDSNSSSVENTKPGYLMLIGKESREKLRAEYEKLSEEERKIYSEIIAGLLLETTAETPHVCECNKLQITQFFLVRCCIPENCLYKYIPLEKSDLQTDVIKKLIECRNAMEEKIKDEERKRNEQLQTLPPSQDNLKGHESSAANSSMKEKESEACDAAKIHKNKRQYVVIVGEKNKELLQKVLDSSTNLGSYSETYPEAAAIIEGLLLMNGKTCTLEQFKQYFFLAEDTSGWLSAVKAALFTPIYEIVFKYDGGLSKGIRDMLTSNSNHLVGFIKTIVVCDEMPDDLIFATVKQEMHEKDNTTQDEDYEKSANSLQNFPEAKKGGVDYGSNAAL